MSDDTYDIEAILADPVRTRRVVEYAVGAMVRANTKIGPGEFLKMGSEEYAAVSILRMGFLDIEALKAAIPEWEPNQ